MPVNLWDSKVEDNRALDEAGGIYLTSSSSMTLRRTEIQRNRANDFAGGIFLIDSSAELHESSVSFNKAGKSGGGVSSGKYIGVFDIFANKRGTSGIRFIACIIEGNTAEDDGGGLDLYYDITLDLVNTLVRDNTAGAAGSGGGLRIRGKVTLNAENSTISSNYAASGGGLAAADNCIVEMCNVSFELNLAQSDEGGIYSQSTSFSLSRCRIGPQNTAEDGGGAYITQESSLELKEGSLVYGNSGSNGGGAHVSVDSHLIVRDSSFEDNYASSRGETLQCVAVCCSILQCVTFVLQASSKGETSSLLVSFFLSHLLFVAHSHTLALTHMHIFAL